MRWRSEVQIMTSVDEEHPLKYITHITRHAVLSQLGTLEGKMLFRACQCDTEGSLLSTNTKQQCSNALSEEIAQKY